MDSASRSDRFVLAVLALGYLAQVGWRVFLAVGRHGPIVMADELGYLMDGRLLAGGAAGQMAGSMFYQGGYPLVITPAFLLGDDPRRIYLAVLVINALISAAVFPVLYLLLTRPFRIARNSALVVGFLGALYPPLVLYSLLAVPETLLCVLTLAAVLALSRFVAVEQRGPVWGWSAGCGVLAGFLYTTHGRTAPVVALLVAGLVLAGVARRELRLPALSGVLAAAGTLVAGQALNRWLLGRLWGSKSDSGASIVFGHLSDPAVGWNVVVSALGQYWYLTVGSFGLFVLGVWEAVAALRRGRIPDAPGGPGGPDAGRGPLSLVRASLGAGAGGGPVAATCLLAGTAALVLLTGIFLYPPSRPDMVVYGRYAEVMMPAFLALGLYRLRTVRPGWRAPAVLAGGLVVAGLGLLVFGRYQHRLVFGTISNSYTTLSLPWLSGSIDGLHPRRVTAVALAGAAVLALSRLRPRRPAVAALTLLATLGLAVALTASAYGTRQELFTQTQNAVYGPGGGNTVSVPGLGPAQDVGYDLGYLTIEGRWAFQWTLHDTHFVLFNSRNGDRAPPVRYVISGRDWPEAGRLGARPVWSERSGGQVVWLVPSRPPAPLTDARPR